LTATVTPLRLGADTRAVAAHALTAVAHYLDRCKLAANTVTAYRRQCIAYIAWLGLHATDHLDAFADTIGAEAAVTAWRRHLLRRKASPAGVNQALAAVTLLYEHSGLDINVKRARVPSPGEPDALTTKQQGAVERAASRRGARDAAIIAVLLYAGARVEECARLDAGDVAITPAPAPSGYTARATKFARSRYRLLPRAHLRLDPPARQHPRAAVDRPTRPADDLRHHPGRARRWRQSRFARAASPPAAPHLRHPATPRRRRPRPGTSPTRTQLTRDHGPLLPRRHRRTGSHRRPHLRVTPNRPPSVTPTPGVTPDDRGTSPKGGGPLPRAPTGSWVGGSHGRPPPDASGPPAEPPSVHADPDVAALLVHEHADVRASIMVVSRLDLAV
jgi:integrase